MTTEQRNKNPIIQSNTNPDRALTSWIPFSIVAILFGIFVSSIGFSMLEDLPGYASTEDQLLPMLVFVFGVISLMLGIVYPFFSRMIAKKHCLLVFEDHIEGTGVVIVGGTQSLISFHEKMESISSVSLSGKKLVAINLSNGNSIRCLAYNAQEIVTEIRKLIN